MEDKYDYVVIGSGPAGYVSAVKASQLGKKTLIIEKEVNKIGGVCLNEGCIPAKSLYHSASLYKKVKNSPYVQELEFNEKHLSDIVSIAKDTSLTLSKGLEFLFKKNNIDLLFGTASFKDKNTLTVLTSEGEKEVTGQKILIATGSATAQIPGIIFVPGRVITSKEVISLSILPKKVLIVGGGAIGVEFADYFNSLDIAVSIVDIAENLLPFEDDDVSRTIGTILKKKGVKL
ncbi:MAG: NAD(P)/FAD-dependent oxidoreductase [Candidatus Omnitrophica bacterium]|nr:NAD(P)/FAD-dependent oxidoreductase [Candidatus Omnitrophota bacterium]